MNADERFTPQQALREVGRVDGRVRDSSRGPGWMYLVTGVATMIYWPVMFLANGAASVVAAFAWIALTIAICSYWWRRKVYEQRLMRIRSRMTIAYVSASSVTFAVGAFVAPRHPTPTGWAVAIIALAVISGTPLLYAAWRLLTRR